MKKFFETTDAKRAIWTIINSVMALTVSMIAYLASDNVTWAISVLPFAQAVSQFITKTLNSRV
jgi:hypothetical protein